MPKSPGLTESDHRTTGAFAVVAAALLACGTALLGSHARGAASSGAQASTSLREVRTMRVDYVHSGGLGTEQYSLDGVVVEGAWPGNPDRTIDDTNLGKYFFEVRDRGTNRVIYSRGFATVFGEWETTDEATKTTRAFHESVRFPEPAGPVQVTIKKRDAQNAFREAWSVLVDPTDPFVDRSGPPASVKAWAVMQSGAPRDKVDVALIGDGYTAAEMEKWHADARRLAELLFAVSPFRERRSDFNVWAIDVASDESGVARPSDGVQRRSAVRAAYDAFGSERYVLTFDDKRLREIASAAPYEFIEIVVNDRKYGGGGIHNQYATVAADNAFTPYVLVHEFAHHFAGLADEYYTSDVSYESAKHRPEPWEKNVTADPAATKWRDLCSPGIALPTPWPKAEFEARLKDVQARRRAIRARHAPEAEMEALFREELEFTTKLLGSGPNAGKVGAFEGAMYESAGYYRPQTDCIMFTRDEVGFCAVCRRALTQVIDFYAGQKP